MIYLVNTFILISFFISLTCEAEDLYHGVYPGGFTGEEDDFSELDIESYERAVGKKAAFIYFSHNWYKGREFPSRIVNFIYKNESTPFIRLMLRSSPNRAHDEKLYTLDAINSGIFDQDFIKWFKVAKFYNKLMFVEYGVEINGQWFPWNGLWNGKKLGPNKFKKAYQRIISISRDQGANNIKWAFHIDCNEFPKEHWNRFENYYPGDSYINLITISAYGMLTPVDTHVIKFRDRVEYVYNRIKKLSPKKKIIVIEFGTTKNNKYLNQENWASVSLDILLSNNYPNIIGFSWWNEWWHNPKPIPDTSMRVQDNKYLAEVFKNKLKSNKIKSNILMITPSIP